MEEIWKDIPDYEKLYQASNLGRIKSLERQIISKNPQHKNGKRTVKERILKCITDKDGYHILSLSKNSTQRKFKVHQLVTMAFLNHIPNGLNLVINHINFIKSDNRLENLEIVTLRENSNKKHIKHSSNFTGVYRKQNKWYAGIQLNGKFFHLGSFKTEEEASEYYEAALVSINNGTEIKTKPRTKASKYKGVILNKKSNKWVSRIVINGKQKHIGTYQSEIDAHLAYQHKLNLLSPTLS